MRTPVSAGNWKMNPPAPGGGGALIKKMKEALADVTGVDIVVCPPALWLERAREIVRGTRVHLGAQNAHWEDSGAFTGEISASMIAGAVEYVIVGHSERRTYFCETDETVNKRTAAVLRNGLRPITCVGETLAEREAGQTEAVLTRQVRGALVGLDIPDGFILAYEPVWAIGTGRAATPEMANEAIALIRRQVAGRFGETKAAGVRILYGGSVTAANVESLMAQPELDGALVGGASLRPDEFGAITRVIAGSRQ